MVQLVRAPRTAPTLRHMVLNIALNLGRADLAEELLGALFLQGDRSADWSNAETRLAALVDDREEVAQTLKRSQALFGRRLSKTGPARGRPHPPAGRRPGRRGGRLPPLA
jgi:hypothetical protein